jgi:hypothetical protein
MKLPTFGIDPKKLVKEGHVILEEVTVVFGHNKANGYTSQSGDPFVFVLFKCFHNTFTRCPRFSALFV